MFKIAHKVHVQSGPYSFAFEYKRDSDEGGLGMITPLNEEHGTIPEGYETRMVLHLLGDCNRDALFNEFQALPDTLLLFLRKLTVLIIRLKPAVGPEVEKVY